MIQRDPAVLRAKLQTAALIARSETVVCQLELHIDKLQEFLETARRYTLNDGEQLTIQARSPQP